MCLAWCICLSILLNLTFSSRVPLLVEVWDREEDKSQSSLLGSCRIPLDRVLEADRAKAVVRYDTR